MRRIALVFLFLCHACVAWASHDRPAKAAKDATAPMTDGEVRRVDRAAAELMIRHAALEDLQLPAMTMLFQVPSPDMLKGLAPGDRVKFRAEKSGTGYRILELRQIR